MCHRSWSKIRLRNFINFFAIIVRHFDLYAIFNCLYLILSIVVFLHPINYMIYLTVFIKL